MSRLQFWVSRIGGEAAYLAAATGNCQTNSSSYDRQKLLNAQVLDLRAHRTSFTDQYRFRISGMQMSASFQQGIPGTLGLKTRADLLNANLPAARECASSSKDFPASLLP